MTKYSTVLVEPNCTTMYYTEDIEEAEMLEYKIRNEYRIESSFTIGEIDGDEYTVVFNVEE